ncbi:MAG: hypothetical protein HY709_04505 [Candidatus Latescibacteria bacterium]|nr:hypothetical protein [Candidatus Latescibacterota bacterium]
MCGYCFSIVRRSLAPWTMGLGLLILGSPVVVQGNSGMSDSASVVPSDSLLSASVTIPKMIRSSDAWLARDKALHFSISAGLVGALYQGDRHVFGMSIGRSRWVASLSTLTVGALKEVRDRYHPGSTASLRDLAADSAGILIGMLLFSYVAQ